MSNDDFAPEPTDAEIATEAAYWRAVYTSPAYLAAYPEPTDDEIERALDSME